MPTGLTTFGPNRTAWTWLLLPMSPIICFGLYCLSRNAYVEAALSLAFAAFVVGYNLTIRLTVTQDAISFRRFGRLVWSAPVQGTELTLGRGGDGNLLPAYVVSTNGERVGFVLKSWFSEEVIKQVSGHLRT